jgi:hypothetical protein
MPINSYSRIPLNVAVKAMFACSEGSLFAVKVHCSTEDPLSELSLIPSESPSSYYELQLCQLIHSHNPFKLFLHLLLSKHIWSCVMFDLTARSQ